MSLFTIDMEGIKNLRTYFETAPEAAQAAARDSINGAIRFAYAESSRQIRKQVNFSQDYIGSVAQGNRLKVSLYATSEALQARLSATKRAVSLARFAVDRSLGGKNGVTVEVRPGHQVTMKTAFLIKLKAGAAAVTQDSYNLGLAIRLKPGQTVFNKNKVLPYGKGDPTLYLVYGPSVDQVFNTVRDDIEPPVAQFLEAEFFRQFARHNA